MLRGGTETVAKAKCCEANRKSSTQTLKCTLHTTRSVFNCIAFLITLALCNFNSSRGWWKGKESHREKERTNKNWCALFCAWTAVGNGHSPMRSDCMRYEWDVCVCRRRQLTNNKKVYSLFRGNWTEYGFLTMFFYFCLLFWKPSKAFSTLHIFIPKADQESGEWERTTIIHRTNKRRKLYL